MHLKKIPKPKFNSWIFLIIVLILYTLLLLFQQDLFYSSIKTFFNIFLEILPVFILVFIIMSITNFFITPKFIIKHLKEKGIKKWIFVVIGGILSSGPIYMWYPLLKDLKNKGLNQGLIACFLYNRAIKIPFLPIAITYFGWKYVLVLTLVTIFISIIQGILLKKILK